MIYVKELEKHLLKLNNIIEEVKRMIEGSSNRGDSIDFNEETGTLSASTYSYEISSCGY